MPRQPARPRGRQPSRRLLSGGHVSRAGPPLKLRITYRSTGPGNRKGRPAFFDKLLSLVSLLRAVDECDDRPALLFVNDGPIPVPRLDVMRAAGEVVALDGAGNSGSYRRALSLTCSQGEDADLVYLVEDDYFHLPQALATLQRAAADLPEASYFTLYDHPDHYLTEDGGQATGRLVWRPVASTTMTFAARPDALRADRWLHWLGTVPHTPRDHKIWLAAQRRGPFRFLPRTHRRPVLVAPVPGLATHLEHGMLAPGVDWDAAADDARRWAAHHDLPSRDSP